MTNFDEYRDVFVVADTIDDVVHPVTYELIGQARRIAKELIKILRGFGMHVLAYDLYPDHEFAKQYDVKVVELDELYAQSDIISLHCPLTEQNRAFVNTSLLERAAPGLILVNTARGALIDDIAVAEALQSGRLGAYACDVLSTEPPAADHPILSAPNTFVTPHIAWATAAARGRIVRIMADNLKAFLAGAPQNVVS